MNEQGELHEDDILDEEETQDLQDIDEEDNPIANQCIVFPVKITTRERIVQPFAHQRILDSVFGEGQYKSVLVCVSETQRDKENNVKEICVPGTIRLFQKHLARLSGIYYLDPPERYLNADLQEVISVGTLGQLLTSTLPELIQA
jgi:hypothetical protein